METTTFTKKPRKKKVLVKRKRDRLQLITDLIKTNCIGSQSELADMLRERCGVEVELITMIGPVIGAHSGPGTLALFFLGSER